MENNEEEQSWHGLFRIGVIVKGLQGVIEIIASAFIYFIPLHLVVRIADRLTEAELIRDPNDFIATHLVMFAQSLSIGSKSFAAVFLLINGIVKIGLAFALLKNKRWAYPVGASILGVLVTYALYRVYLHHSLLLLAASILDLIIIGLILREYARTKD